MTCHVDRSSRPDPLRPSRRGFLGATLAGGALLGVGALDRLRAPARADAAADDSPVPPEVKAAVDKALSWLATGQKDNGSWPAGSNDYTSITSLSVMAYLARGHLPGRGPYGEGLNKAIDFVLSQQKDTGLIAGTNGNAHMYEHGISSSMLSEAYGMIDDTRKGKIEKAMAKSSRLIINAQTPHGQPKPMPHTGGWRYTESSEDSDISVTGWQLMALRGAANCGASIPASVLDAGREYVRRCAVPKDAGGGFTYQAGQRDANPPRTGTGIVALELLGDHGSAEAIAGGDYLLEHPLTDPNQSFYYYGIYYVSQAFNQLGGKYWDTGYSKLRSSLLGSADPKTGSWLNGNGQEGDAGPAYRTAMACLALCVPFRYLPLYQK